MPESKDLYRGQEEAKADKKKGGAAKWPEGVAEVRITAGEASNAMVKGVQFTGQPQEFEPGELDWDEDELIAAEGIGLTIERFDKDGNLLKRDGSPYPTLSKAPQAPSKKGKKEE